MISTAITDREIAILCDVAERHAGFFNAEKREILDQLIGRGFVERSNRDFRIRTQRHGWATSSRARCWAVRGMINGE